MNNIGTTMAELKGIIMFIGSRAMVVFFIQVLAFISFLIADQAFYES